jgi:putative peptide zinc metalloprotease protein
MFVASVTTILFNGNPLMRYDAYYILSDVFEIPNLSGRSKLHLKYVFRKFMFGVRQAVSPSYDFFESSFMTVYGVLAEAYKFVIFSSLILLASELNPALGLIGLCAYLFIGVVMPLFKFFRYLVIDPELARTRVRSLGISALIFGGLLYLILGIELNDRIVVEGVIEPVNLKQVYIQSDGFVTLYKKRQFPVKKDETVIYIADNPELTLEIEQAKAEMEGLEVLIRAYAGVQPARKTIHQNSYNALLKKVELLKQETERLVAKAPISGLFIPIGDRDITGKFMAKGEKLGIIVSPNDLIIRSVISQDTSRILEESSNTVKFRLRARPDLEFSGVVDSREAVGKNKLPSVALGYHGGGETEVNSTEQGNESKEFFFEIVLKPEDKPWPLKPGQIVAVRFELQKKSIFEIVEGFVNRLLLRRFRI